MFSPIYFWHVAARLNFPSALVMFSYMRRFSGHFVLFVILLTFQSEIYLFALSWYFVCFQSMLLTNFLSSLRMLKVNIQIILLYFGYQFTSFKFLVTHKLAPSMYLGLYNTLTMCSRFNVNQLLTECCKQNTKLCRGQVCDLTSNDFCTFLIYVHLCPSEVCISVLGHIQSKNF